MSTTDEGGDYYPRIESITDSFGFKIDGAQTLASYNPLVATKLTLEVGQVVTFDCHATDPRGRLIHWKVTAWPGGEVDSATGDDVELRWTVSEASVGDQVMAQMRMISDGKYHRWGGEGIDGLAIFSYKVRPPE